MVILMENLADDLNRFFDRFDSPTSTPVCTTYFVAWCVSPPQTTPYTICFRGPIHTYIPLIHVRFTFFDFLSAFNTIKPRLLGESMSKIKVELSLVPWCMDDQSNRPQYAECCVSYNPEQRGGKRSAQRMVLTSSCLPSTWWTSCTTLTAAFCRSILTTVRWPSQRTSESLRWRKFWDIWRLMSQKQTKICETLLALLPASAAYNWVSLA